jgi:hypothetical protein
MKFMNQNVLNNYILWTSKLNFDTYRDIDVSSDPHFPHRNLGLHCVTSRSAALLLGENGKQ